MNERTANRTFSALQLVKGEKWLACTGLLGFLLAGICAVRVMLYGGPVAPDGDVSKAFSFNAALGLFLISTAAVIPFSQMGERSRAVFRWTYIVLALYSYFAETVQHFRGVNPRFVQDGTSFDVAVGSIFALVALLLVLFYLFLAVQYFRKKAYAQRPGLVLGIRYSMIAVMASFAAGIWISTNQGSHFGAGGNIIWLHGLGFHALQAVPLMAWLAERSPSSTAGHSRKWIHFTGVAYLLGLGAVAWQTYLGYPIVSWSALPLAAFGFFFVALLPAAYLLRQTKFARRQDLLRW